jgi:riboflavin kinase/FMN adenylyltransferase
MRIHRHAEHLPAAARGSVVALGNFDGVHRGHQAVIGEAVRRARAGGTTASVLTFEPHPRRYFKPDTPPFLLTRFRTKARVVAGLGVDHLFVLRFNRDLANLSAETFIDEILLAGLDAGHVVVGYDFVFGKGRAGRPETLRDRLAARGVGTTVMPAVTASVDLPATEGEADAFVVSSTGVRDALKGGDPRAAARLLGRTFEIEGRVQRGDRRGRLIGFPTANLWLGDYLRPALGVYAVRVAVTEAHDSALTDNVAWHEGVANLGVRPTFGGLAEPRLEVHLFEFDGDLYGRRLRVALVEFLRPEQKFAGLDALRAQIAKDAEAARRALAAPSRRAVPPRLSEADGIDPEGEAG